MSTFTKEQLIARINQVTAINKYRIGRDPAADGLAMDNELFAIALASLEAEPVAWLLSGGGAKNNVSFDSGNAYADPLREVTPLYTAPPAQVSVPDESAIFDAAIDICRKSDAIDEHAWNHGVLAVMSAFSDCRAAMLKHSEPFIVTSDHRMMEMPQVEAINAVTAMLQGAEPVTTAYKLPEGWVAVPVEPTEHMIVEGFESEPDEFFSDAELWEAYDAMSGCQQAVHRAKLCWAAMIAAAPKV